MKLEDYKKARDRITQKSPVYNPVKENLKKGFRFIKLFWAIILLAIVLFVWYKFGDKLGLTP